MSKHNLGSALQPKFGPEAMKLASGDSFYSSEKLKSLGFTFKRPRFEGGWIETIKERQSQGGLPVYQ